jgi:hypothetical protein
MVQEKEVERKKNVKAYLFWKKQLERKYFRKWKFDQDILAR